MAPRKLKAKEKDKTEKYLSENEVDVNDSLGRIETQPSKVILDVVEMKGDIKHLVQAVDGLTTDFKSYCEGTNIRVRDLELSKATLEGKASQGSVYVAYGISFLSFLLTAASRFIK
jgi:hypothetical protein